MTKSSQFSIFTNFYKKYFPPTFSMCVLLKDFWSYKKLFYFLSKNSYTTILVKNVSLLKLPDKVILENYVIICKYLNQALPKTF